MPGVQTAERTRTAGNLRLELTFVYGWSEALAEEYGGGADPEAFHAPARLSECVDLLHLISQLVGHAEAAEKFLPLWQWHDMDDVVASLRRFQPQDADGRVLLLHYGSPFSMQVYLALSPPGLGLLLYGVKRLFGLDLELLTHRETKRAEYLEALEVVAALERAAAAEEARSKDRPSVVAEGLYDAGQELPWEARGGVIRDESE